MRLPVRSTAAAAVIAGAGYWALVAYAQEQFRNEIDLALRQLPAGYTAAYASIAVSPSSRQATVSGFTLKNSERQLDLRAETIELADIGADLSDGWNRAAGNPAAVLTVGGRIVLRGVSYTLGDSSIKFADASVERLNLHPWALAQADAQSPLMTLPMAIPAIDPANPDDLAAVVRAQAAQVMGVSFDRFAVAGLSATIGLPAGPGEPPKTVRYGVRRMAVDRYTPGRIGVAMMEGMSAEGDDIGTWSLDHATMADIDAAAPLGRILAGEPFSETTVGGLVLGRIEYAGMTMKPQTDAGGSVELLSVSDVRFVGAIPVSLAMAVHALRIDTQAMAGLPTDLSQFGFDNAATSFGFAYNWDAAARRVSLRDAMLEVEGLGKLDLTFDFGEASLPDLNWEQATLVGGRIRYADISLIERGLAMLGATRDELIAEIRDQGRAFGNSPAAVAGLSALVQFIGASGTLTVETRPPVAPPVGRTFEMLSIVPELFFSTLGLSITASP